MNSYILKYFINSFYTGVLIFIAILLLNITYEKICLAEEINQQSSNVIKNNQKIPQVKDSNINNEIRYKNRELEFNNKNGITKDREGKSIQELTVAEAAKKIEEAKAKGQDTRSMEVDYYLKFSLPLATFFVALIAAPIGIKFAKRGAYFGVAISIALVFVWYVTYSIGRSLGGNGVIPPVLAAWIQNIALGVIGIILLTFVNRK